MNTKIHARNLDLSSNHEKLIGRHCTKLGKLLATFSADTVELDVSLERLTRGSQFQTGLVLTLPQRVIRVEEIENNPTTSVVRAFGELHRRVKKFKSQLSRERLWRKSVQVPSEPGALTRWELESEANTHLEKLENYIRREIFHQVLLGTLPPGIIEPQAIVDEVFLFLTSRPEMKPSSLTVEQWMFQTARSIVRDRLQELEDHREDAHMGEEAVQGGSWEDEDLNFYQPDEALHLEDLLKDGNTSNPEELLERYEVEGQLQRSIAILPSAVRESFILFALEGFTSDEVAMMTGKTPALVLGEVEEARDLLRQSLK